MAAPRSCAGRVLTRCGRARLASSAVVLCFALLDLTGCRSTEPPGSGAVIGNVPLDCARVGGAAARRRRRLVAAGGRPLPPDACTCGRKRSGLPPLGAPAGWSRRRGVARPLRSADPGDPCQLGAPSGERGRPGDRRDRLASAAISPTGMERMSSNAGGWMCGHRTVSFGNGREFFGQGVGVHTRIASTRGARKAVIASAICAHICCAIANFRATGDSGACSEP